MNGANTMGLAMGQNMTKSAFINQLDGGYTINLQGQDFTPVKVAVTIDEVTKIINDFFTNVNAQTSTPSQTSEPMPTAEPDTIAPQAETPVVPDLIAES